MVLVLAVAFFAAGYFFYASLMAAIGALAPSLKEAGPLTLAILVPAWAPFLVIRPILSDPGGRLARTLTMLPPTAPLVALLRASVSDVPALEVALSLAALVGSAVLVLWAAGRWFQASISLGGGFPSPLQLVGALRN
jgi:ABC-2 type transport system permease protein